MFSKKYATTSRASGALMRRSAWFRRVIPFGVLQREETIASAESQAIGSLVTEQVWQVVLGLPAKLREVLLLHAHHGLSYAEIARLLSVSEGTVKSRLYRARAKVSEQLHQAEGGDGRLSGWSRRHGRSS